MTLNERQNDTVVVYTRENVTIHHTHSDRISGRLKLIKQQHHSLLMTWIPYKGQNSTASSDKDMGLYTIRDVPFTDISSIRRHTPTLGWQYVIIVLSSGLAFPPLYFYSGGVKEFLATIKQHVFLARSADDANVFRVNDFQNPLQRTLSSLDMGVSVANVPIPISAGSGADQERLVSDRSSGRQKKKQNDISINLLEKFSHVTRFARETTSQLFRESHVDGFNHNEWKKNDNSVNERRKNDNSVNERRKNDNSVAAHDEITTGSDENQKVSDQVPVAPDPVEWATFLDSEGRIKDPKLFRKRIFYGGVEHTLRKEVWTFLLGYHSYESTYAERNYLMSTKKSDYELIKKQWQTISREQARKFTKFRERKGLIDKDVVRTDRSISFYDGDDNPNVHVLRDILLTYSFYNFDLGYCQGMSDLLSPILFVMRDESESFWCFVYLMERLGPNFNRDQSGMHSQLFALSKLVELLDSPLHDYFKQNDCLNYFFCFRWILIQFKRELEYEDTMRLWEVLWTHYPSEHLHLYICIAILKRYRSKIMGEEMDFDTLLKFINELSGKINLDATLRDAEALCIYAGENGEASIPPGTPPSLPFEDASMYPQLDDDDVL